MSGAGSAQPVEYAVAVDRFLAAARLGGGSRRVYRIALTTWAWALVDRPPPVGTDRRNAAPPALPLALLDGEAAADRVRAAFTARSAAVGPRTANRELSILGSAFAWWRAQGWLGSDPLAAIRPLPVPRGAADRSALDHQQVHAVFRLPAPLREQTFWHLLYDTAAPIERLLALDATQLDLPARRTRDRTVRWSPATARLLPLLTLGHPTAPLFRTTPRTPLSYRRAAELFTTATTPLSTPGPSWTLRQLQAAGDGRGAGRVIGHSGCPSFGR